MTATHFMTESQPNAGQTVFAASFAAVAVSAAQDVFELVAATAMVVNLREVRLGQYSDFGDAAAEILSVQIIKGYTVSGSGGSTPTPGDIVAAAVAGATVEANNTTVANTGTVKILVADAFNVQAGWWYRPPADERIRLAAGERLVVRITAPADALTMNGTLVFDEAAA
jgi:hypothetical protein